MYILLKNGDVISTPEINFNNDHIDWAVPVCEEDTQSRAFYNDVQSISHEDPRVAPIDDHHYDEQLPY